VVSAAQTSLIEMEYAMEEGIAIIIMLTGIAVAIICVILMLYEMNKTLQKNSESLSKIEQHLGDTEEKVKVDKQIQPVVTDNVDDSA
jgi:beta-lactamase regulating signal transducer with metallopeptidase domain